MLRFRRMQSLQTFAVGHGSVRNLFITEPSLSARSTYKQARAAAMVEWRELCAD
jgi:putative transposase